MQWQSHSDCLVTRTDTGLSIFQVVGDEVAQCGLLRFILCLRTMMRQKATPFCSTSYCLELRRYWSASGLKDIDRTWRSPCLTRDLGEVDELTYLSWGHSKQKVCSYRQVTLSDLTGLTYGEFSTGAPQVKFGEEEVSQSCDLIVVRLS